MTLLQQVVDAWKAAERELGIEVQSPFVLDGTEFPLLISSFGSPNGALPLLIGDQDRFLLAQHAKCFATQLNPDTYRNYSRRYFIDTLNDWQWFGQGEPPDWYTGKEWD